MSFSLQNCFLSFVLLNFATSINAVPVMSADGLNSTSSDPIYINDSVTVLDTTLPPVELTTVMDMVNLRNARSDEESVKPNAEPPINPDQEKAKSSAIQFPKDDVDAEIVNVTSVSSSSPVAPVIKEDTTDSSVSEVGMESNGTITEGIIETSSSSSSSTKIDLLSTTQKPLVIDNATEIISSSTSSSNSSIVDSEIRVGRSQPDTVEDEINANLTQTLAALTTLSSIINQTTVNDSLSTVV